MFDEKKLLLTLAELESAISNNAEVNNACIEEVIAAARNSADGQNFLQQNGCCSILYRLLQKVSDKFKVEEDNTASKPTFKAGDAVNTVWGAGTVQSYRERDGLYIVLLNHWKLAQGQSPTLYLGADAMTKSAAAFSAGDAVNTVWGAGKVQSYRAQDKMYVVLLDHWKLAQGQSPTLYLGADAMSLRDLEYERKLAEVKAAHDDAIIKIASLLTAIGAIMRRSLPKTNSCRAAIASFVELGFVDLLPECLNKFMHDPASVNAACWCVMVMCSDDPDNQVALAKAGACEGVMQALSTHASNADIIEYVCRAARNLTSNLSIAQHCVGSGIGELIACVIILHINRPAQCEAGLWVVTNLSCDSNNATVLGGIGMCDAITTVLRTHLNNAAIAAAATWTVKNLACGSKFNYSQFIHTDVCDSLLAILKNFPEDIDVLSSTLWALANITCDPALSVKINENEEICDLIVSILRDFIAKTQSSVANQANDTIDFLDIVEAAMWALRNLASAGATRSAMCDTVSTNVLQVLTDDYFLTDESLVDSALATMVNILSNLAKDNDNFRDQARLQGFGPIFQSLLSKHAVPSIQRHASKAICMFALDNEANRQMMLDNGVCRSAVSMMHANRRDESLVQAAVEVLFKLYFCHIPSEVSRLVDMGAVTVTVDEETGHSTMDISFKPFDEIVAAWLPSHVTEETDWLAKSSSA